MIPDQYANILYNRDKIINGTVKVAFAPGQNGDVITDDDNGNSIYTLPNDWPKVGTLVRPPQVVMLGGYYNSIDIPVQVISLPAKEYGAQWSGSYNETASYFAIPGEADRINSILAEVKSRIEAIRPNRTWVNTNDSITINGTTFPGNGSVSAGPYNTTISMCPDDVFIGTDSLLINLTAMNPRMDFDGVETFDYNSIISKVIARFKQFGPYFVRYESWCYSYDGQNGTYDTLPPYSFTFVPGDRPWTPGLIFPGNATIYYPEGTKVITITNPDGSTTTGPEIPSDWGAAISDFTTQTINQQIVQNNLILSTMNKDNPGGLFNNTAVNSANNINQFISAINQENIYYKGNTKDITADALVIAIASHFNFDPNSGKDLST